MIEMELELSHLLVLKLERAHEHEEGRWPLESGKAEVVDTL
jgi:hypothetical protein